MQQRLCKRMNLRTVIDNEHVSLDLLCVHDRLNNFLYNQQPTKPIVLANGSKIVKLFAENMHRTLNHQGYRVVFDQLCGVSKCLNLSLQNVFNVALKEEMHYSNKFDNYLFIAIKLTVLRFHLLPWTFLDLQKSEKSAMW